MSHPSLRLLHLPAWTFPYPEHPPLQDATPTPRTSRQGWGEGIPHSRPDALSLGAPQGRPQFLVGALQSLLLSGRIVEGPPRLLRPLPLGVAALAAVLGLSLRLQQLPPRRRPRLCPRPQLRPRLLRLPAGGTQGNLGILGGREGVLLGGVGVSPPAGHCPAVWPPLPLGPGAPAPPARGSAPPPSPTPAASAAPRSSPAGTPHPGTPHYLRGSPGRHGRGGVPDTAASGDRSRKEGGSGNGVPGRGDSGNGVLDTGGQWRWNQEREAGAVGIVSQKEWRGNGNGVPESGGKWGWGPRKRGPVGMGSRKARRGKANGVPERGGQ